EGGQRLTSALAVKAGRASAATGRLGLDGYLRVLFVQAARVVLLRPESWQRHGRKRWIEAAATRMHYIKLAIALANKLARIAWSVLHHGRHFEIRKLSQPTVA